ncbi:MAG: hypothetical protein ACJAXD_002066 [Cryomorphaceae bacterium]|jgi:hypothetical protein
MQEGSVEQQQFIATALATSCNIPTRVPPRLEPVLIDMRASGFMSIRSARAVPKSIFSPGVSWRISKVEFMVLSQPRKSVLNMKLFPLFVLDDWAKDAEYPVNMTKVKTAKR